ncbi:hypothetical protein HDE_05708 [Halotydeus destructor]|nr:hypothetical protein HDE_05708 [Halotydeus destructor]
MASSKLFTVLICTLGFTYQAGQVCLAYFSYPSSSSIDLTKSRDLYVPSLSYCISHHSSDPGETIADIDERMATWAALVICKIRVLGPNYSLATYDCHNVSQVVTRVLGILWCMQYQNGDMKTLRALATQDNVMVLGIKQHMLTKHAILFLHSSGMGISRRSQMVTIQDGHHFVHFKKLGVTRLPAPYGGRCRNYQQDGFSSAGDCLDQCIVKQAMKAFQLWPREVAASGQQHVAMLLNGSVMALEKCSNHCQEADCQVDNYIVDSSFLKPIDTWSYRS